MRLTVFLIIFFLSQVICAAYLPPAISDHAMVTSSEKRATRVGVEVLKSGGNAVDAAVAMGYALAVTEPCCGNLGGGGFMLLRMEGQAPVAINFREKAPLAARPELFLNEHGKVAKHRLQQGFLAVGVPGTVMGLNTALEKYGTKPLGELIAPAVRLAEEGFKLSEGMATRLQAKADDLKHDPFAAHTFLKDGLPLKAGTLLKQPALAQALKDIAKGGTARFYEGDIADEIVLTSRANYGVLAKADFESYSVQVMSPVHCQYRGYDIYAPPPPSSGGVTLCEMLNILSSYPLGSYGFHSAKSIHVMAEAMRHAYADRNRFLGDPDFTKNPIARLTSMQYADAIRKKIPRRSAGDSQKVCPREHISEGPHTTHYSVVDAMGNAVSVTYTLDDYFGAKVMTKKGFFLNNELSDFAIVPGKANRYGLVQGKGNVLAGGKRPLSSMTPTIVMKDHEVVASLGTPGGSTIISTVLQILTNVFDFGQNIQAAVSAPRFHMQCAPDVVYLEKGGLSPDTRSLLKKMKYHLREGSPYGTKYWGAANGAVYNATVKQWQGGFDVRRPGGMAEGG